MVSKEEMINMLREAADFEERCAPLIEMKSKECLEEISQLSLTVEDKRKVKELLLELVSDTTRHEYQLTKLMEYVTRSSKDEF